MEIFRQQIHIGSIGMMIIYFISVLLFLTSPVLAANYTVTEDGKGADYSAAKFNALDGDYSGATFYFSGMFSTRIDNNGIYGTKGNPVVLDGYRSGDCDPIDAVCSSSALLQEGMDIGSNSGGPDYVTIQDFRMTCSSTQGACFRILPDFSETDGSGWSEGCLVRRNYVYQTYSSMVYFSRTKFLTVENNKFVHFGQGYNTGGGFSVNCAEDVIVQNNEIGHNDDSYPSSADSANTANFHGIQRGLVQYNDIYGGPTGSCLTFKEDGFPPYSGNTDNIIARFNHVHDCREGKGISLIMKDGQSLNRAYIYGNFIRNAAETGIRSQTGTSNIHIWSNVIVDSGDRGILIGPKGAETPPVNVFVINNTVARGNTDGHTDINVGGIIITGGTNIHVKNNIMWNNRPTGAGSKFHQIYSSITLSSLEHNTLYHNLATASYYYLGAFRNLTSMMNTYNLEDDAPAGIIEHSGFKDPDGADNIYGTADDNYTLNGTHSNNGADLSQCFDVSIQGKNHHICYEDALDPNTTNWKTTPPTVRTTKQKEHGSWDRGAYAYIDKVAQSEIISEPTNLRISTP